MPVLHRSPVSQGFSAASVAYAHDRKVLSVTGSLVGRQAGADFAGDGDELVVERWVERRSHGFSYAARLGARYDQQPEWFEPSLAEMIEAVPHAAAACEPAAPYVQP
jgi:hypothetical protein